MIQLIPWKIQKVEQPLTKATKRTKEKTQINKIRGAIQQKIYGDILKTYSPANWKNQEEIVKFLGPYDLPKLKQEDIKNLIVKSKISNEIETVQKNLLTKKKPGPHGFTAIF
jgi:hypothetical protein